ncbi:hypothetical protein DPM19_10730 [Actinomadura craniellae]|uniref:Uncharacterized protein n=1 Tax=Actinomadura craniellae TaxID=2231787 RepID=A0A365H828_9ACTN|nr:hypothetical protein [Actinomadura craniellae]RAY15189.1 hypothetical protein DPM19_10730 [Actinomadura craniellae]
MSQVFHQLCEETVQAALVEDQSFGSVLPRLIDEARHVPAPVLSAALPRLAQGVAEAPPNLGGWLAVCAGAWVENGADPDPVGTAIVDRLTEVAAAALAFADAWEAATGDKPPHMQEEQPSQHALNVVSPTLGEGGVPAMMAWFSLPQFAMGACTVLARGPRVRAAVTDRPLKILAAERSARYWGQMDYVKDLLQVLDDHPLLVLDRQTRRGWMVTISGIGDNFQLHTLLAAALVDRPQGVPGRAPDPRWVAASGDGDLQPDTPSVVGWWNLVDARGGWIWNEGVPADIPEVNGVRVVVLDPPAYERVWSPGRRFPLMPGSLTVNGTYTADELAGWWPHIAPARSPGRSG